MTQDDEFDLTDMIGAELPEIPARRSLALPACIALVAVLLAGGAYSLMRSPASPASATVVESQTQAHTRSVPLIRQPIEVAALGDAALSANESLLPVMVSDPTRPACVIAAEQELLTLARHNREAGGLQWRDARFHITAISQDVLDCNGARFHMRGNLDLIEAGLADLQMRWLPKHRKLVMTTIAAGSDGIPLRENEDVALDVIIRGHP